MTVNAFRYGFQHLETLSLLEKSRLVYPNDGRSKPSWPKVKQIFNLLETMESPSDDLCAASRGLENAICWSWSKLPPDCVSMANA